MMIVYGIASDEQLKPIVKVVCTLALLNFGWRKYDRVFVQIGKDLKCLLPFYMLKCKLLCLICTKLEIRQKMLL